MKTFNFKTAQEMLDVIKNGKELYSPSDEIFVTICGKSILVYYDLDITEAKKLEHEARETGEYWWSSMLNDYDGWACDESDTENGKTNLDFCKLYYTSTWVETPNMFLD